MVGPLVQPFRQQANHLGYKRNEIVHSVAACEHDDDRNAETLPVLLVRNPTVNRDECIESAVRRKAEQTSVFGACPARLRNGWTS